MSALAILLTLAIPSYFGRAVDALIAAHPEEHVPAIGLSLVVLAVAQALTRIFGIQLLISAAKLAERDLRDHVFQHVVQLDAGFYRSHSGGEIASRMSNDVQLVVVMWSGGVIQAFGAGLMVCVACVAMFLIAPGLALLALLPAPLIMFGASRLSRLDKQRTTETMKQLGSLSGSVEEDLAGIGVIRGYHLQEAREKRFREQATLLAERRVRAQAAAAYLPPLLNSFTATSMFVVLWVGGNAVIDGDLRIGTLLQFSAYVGMVGARVPWLGDTVSTFQRGRAGWSRIVDLLAQRSAIQDGPGPGFDTDVRGELELRDLTIEIDGRRILDRVSLKVPAGSTCAIVGPVGSGKSTLIQALPRLVDVPPGTVFLDGRDITQLPLRTLRSHLAYAAQGPFVFSMSIADNIALGFAKDGQTDLDRIRRAADAAGLTPDLAMLPNGMETQVGERGITVSGGQRQRIALARTLAGAEHRQVILLDDSLSAVDVETERRILENLDREIAGRTLLVVSHRVATLRSADQIAVLDQGKLVEIGTHTELLRRGGVYAELYRSQSEQGAA